jgi:hypothetical protein
MLGTITQLIQVNYGPTGPEASQSQAFTFLVRDQRLGVQMYHQHKVQLV